MKNKNKNIIIIMIILGIQVLLIVGAFLWFQAEANAGKELVLVAKTDIESTEIINTSFINNNFVLTERTTNELEEGDYFTSIGEMTEKVLGKELTFKHELRKGDVVYFEDLEKQNNNSGDGNQNHIWEDENADIYFEKDEWDRRKIDYENLTDDNSLIKIGAWVEIVSDGNEIKAPKAYISEINYNALVPGKIDSVVFVLDEKSSDEIFAAFKDDPNLRYLIAEFGSDKNLPSGEDNIKQDFFSPKGELFEELVLKNGESNGEQEINNTTLAFFEENNSNLNLSWRGSNLRQVEIEHYSFTGEQEDAIFSLGNNNVIYSKEKDLFTLDLRNVSFSEDGIFSAGVYKVTAIQIVENVKERFYYYFAVEPKTNDSEYSFVLDEIPEFNQLDYDYIANEGNYDFVLKTYSVKFTKAYFKEISILENYSMTLSQISTEVKTSFSGFGITPDKNYFDSNIVYLKKTDIEFEELKEVLEEVFLSYTYLDNTIFSASEETEILNAIEQSFAGSTLNLTRERLYDFKQFFSTTTSGGATDFYSALESLIVDEDEEATKNAKRGLVLTTLDYFFDFVKTSLPNAEAFFTSQKTFFDYKTKGETALTLDFIDSTDKKHSIRVQYNFVEVTPEVKNGKY